MFHIHEKAHPGKVVLKVADLEKLTHYYQELGLTILHEEGNRVDLGSEEGAQVLLELRKIDLPNPRRRRTGLYHMAFLVPDRRTLGNVLYSLINKQIPIIGASDHGFSEALYLQDPEGNGIEIYRDKPKEEWDIREDGRIKGITIQMDADGVLASRDKESNHIFPIKTVMGHVHLSVSDLVKTEGFYSQILGLDIKDRYGDQALFFAAGDYHHHIGANTWQSKDASPAKENDLGLDYFSLQVPNKEALEKLKQNVHQAEIPLLEETDNSFLLVDPNGIRIKIEYN